VFHNHPCHATTVILTSQLHRFRWVACQLDHLCNLTTDRERLLALETLPPTLYSTYDRILERLNEKSESACRLVERVLKLLISPARGPIWMHGTFMPLMTARELCVAVSIDPDDYTVSLDDIPSVEEIMVHSSSFLRLSQDRKFVSFAHFTVEEYLRSIDPREKPQLARYHCDELNATTFMAETCLTFLNLDNFRSNLCENLGTIRQLLETYPFYARASLVWNKSSPQSQSSARVLQLVDKLFSSPSNYDNWLQVRLIVSELEDWDTVAAGSSSSITDISSLGKLVSDSPLAWNGIGSGFLRRSIAIAGSTSKMHIAAMFHLVHQIPRLFETESQLNALSPFGTPLHCALYGEVAIPMIMEDTAMCPLVNENTLSSTISVLLDLGSDVRIPFSSDSGGITTPLCLATFSLATQQLLDAGAVLDESTVRAILPRMDDGHELDLGPLAHVSLESVNNRDRRYVEHLLVRINPEKKLAASHTTLWKQAPISELEDILRHACQYNEISIFRWHFEGRNLDVDHRFQDNDESLLHVACDGFAADVVAYLIERGVNAEVSSGSGYTPLAQYFHSKRWSDESTRPFDRHNCLATFQNMVGHKAQLQMLTFEDDTALMWWAKCRSTETDVLEEVLRVLLSKGLDIGSRNADGENVWHLLATKNHVKHSEMLKSLVDPVAFRSSINVADDRGFTPIFDAVDGSSVEMFEFLIEQGCDVTSLNVVGESVLHLATFGIWSGHGMFQSLLTRYMHTKIAIPTFSGLTVAHYCVRSIMVPKHLRGTPPGVTQRFLESIAALTLSSLSVFDANCEGETALDQLCQWIAEEGHHSSDCLRCEACFECFEVLVAHYDATGEHSQLDVTWTTILLRGLGLKAEADADPDDSSDCEYPAETVCSRAICLAIDRGVLLNDLGAELDLDSIFDIAVRLRQESLILKLLDTTSMDFDRQSRKEPHHTPLQALCVHCCPASTISIAISRTKNVCRSDSEGYGPLHMLFFNAEAQHSNMAPAIRALLDSGVDIDENHTALMMAAALETSSDAVDTLLSSGANADLRDSKGWNALLRACGSGTESATKELIDAGSTLLQGTVTFPKFRKKKILCGPIQLAAGRGMSDIVKILLELGRTVGTSDNNDSAPSPLTMACVGGNQETVRLLLERGHDPNLLDVSFGMRPLHVASSAGWTQIVHALLEAGCDKDAPDQNGTKAWMFATMEGHLRIAKILEGFVGKSNDQAVSPKRLLQSAEHRNAGSATSNGSEDQSELPIHSRAMTRYAVHQPLFGRTDVRHFLPNSLRPLLDRDSLRVIESFATGGLDMGGYFQNCTCTPMLDAVACRKPEIVTYFVSIGVPLLTEDKCTSHFPGEYHYTVCELLASHPMWTQSVDQWFHRPKWRAQLSRNALFSMIASAIEHSNCDTLEVLLDKIADPFPSCSIVDWGVVPSEFLHQAVRQSGTSAISCASMLLSHGLDVDCLDRLGRTPLQVAVVGGQLSMVKLLTSHNAALNVETKADSTALSIAAEEGHIEILNHLLASGAHPDFYVVPEAAPVTCAANKGRYAAFRALVNAGGTAKAQDYYALCDSGCRSVLMLDDRYFRATQGPDLLQYIRTPQTALPILRAIPPARRALCFAMLYLEEKTTALYDAAMNGAIPFVDFAVRYGAAINMEGGPEGTPLMVACVVGRLAVVKRLVRSGALLSYWNGAIHVSAFAKAKRSPKILRWLLVGRFTETLRLTENPSGEDLHLDTTATTHGRANDVRDELILKHDIEGYLERNFWFVSPRRFVDSGDGSFSAVDILPSEFAKYKPGFA
jgi:ankyrin repeat protein